MTRSLTSKSLTARTPCFISAGAEATGEPVTSQAEEGANPWGLRDGSVAGLRLDAFPDAETWQDMLTFFRQHQPLRQEVGVSYASLSFLWLSLSLLFFRRTFSVRRWHNHKHCIFCSFSFPTGNANRHAQRRRLARRPREGTRGH